MASPSSEPSGASIHLHRKRTAHMCLHLMLGCKAKSGHPQESFPSFIRTGYFTPGSVCDATNQSRRERCLICERVDEAILMPRSRRIPSGVKISSLISGLLVD